MQEHATTAVGIDIGSTTVRCTIGTVKAGEEQVSLIGIGEALNSGFRKGSVVNINETVQAVDKAIGLAERMAGIQVQSATVNINGAHIKGVDSKGTVAVSGNEITPEDLSRVEDAATVLQLPQHHEILSVFPRSYVVDGQANIKDPLGMSGTRLEVDAHVLTLSAPALKNLEKIISSTGTQINRLTTSSLGAAQAVLTRQQREHGVAVVDIGAATTNMIVIEDGDVQHIAVLPVGGVNITNDLAIGLKCDLKVAEAVKHNYKHLASANKERPKHIKVVVGGKEFIFPTKDIDIVITARLEEIFETVDLELTKIDRSKKLPGGITLAGGSASLPGIAEIAKETLQLPARIAEPYDIGGLKEKVTKPEYAVAAGLMLLDVHKNEQAAYGGQWLGSRFQRLQQSTGAARSVIEKLTNRFKARVSNLTLTSNTFIF